jgi:hypothetical protein
MVLYSLFYALNTRAGLLYAYYDIHAMLCRVSIAYCLLRILYVMLVLGGVGAGCQLSVVSCQLPVVGVSIARNVVGIFDLHVTGCQLSVVGC